MIDLYKQLRSFQRIRIFLLQRDIPLGDLSDTKFRFEIMPAEKGIIVIKAPAFNNIYGIKEKYIRGLQSKVHETYHPEDYLKNERNEVLGVQDNFYEYKGNEDAHLLNKYIFFDYASSIEHILNMFEEDYMEFPTESAHELLMRQGQIADKVYQWLDDYYRRLLDTVYQNILIEIDNLLDCVADNYPDDGKLETTFTVPELALLFRILEGTRKLHPSSNAELYRWLAKNFTSKGQNRISVASIKNNFEKPDPNALREIEGVLKSMQEQLAQM